MSLSAKYIEYIIYLEMFESSFSVFPKKFSSFSKTTYEPEFFFEFFQSIYCILKNFKKSIFSKIGRKKKSLFTENVK